MRWQKGRRQRFISSKKSVTAAAIFGKLMIMHKNNQIMQNYGRQF